MLAVLDNYYHPGTRYHPDAEAFIDYLRQLSSLHERMKACQHEFTDRLLCLHSRNLDSLDLIYFRLRLPERFQFQTEPYSAVPRAVSSSASA